MAPKALLAGLASLVLARGTFLAREEPLILPLPKERERHQQVLDKDRQIEAFEDKSYQATVAELRSARAAVESQAAAASAEAEGNAQQVEELEMQQKVLLAKAKDFNAEVEQNVKYAEASNKDLEKVLADAEAFAKTSDARAQDWAKKSVQDMFLGKYRQLESWRNEVLTDHWAEGRREAQFAAAPYEKAMGEAMEKANSYKSTAKTLRDVANGLQSEADKATLTASAKRMAGDFEGAQRLGDAAKAMRKHGRQLKGYATDLSEESAHLAEAAPTYLSNGKRAAQRAEWKANPESLPPSAANSNLAYLPS
ncbi:unnamed protein product [Effrenium voratum]|nr:unnamed protein product [Effrenium voratum]|mmetsp:Transcript_114292/g.272032  ORF Transcript_114292/g.272032 Transcript_114292/m.272032 type:complete len:310 (+) Transcript_114292:35-964(+)